jgi:steroid delta-isomerase-like uncharacterized protein
MTNPELVERWFEEVWNQGNEAIIEELYASDGISHGLRPNQVSQGPGGFKRFVQELRTVFPDIHVNVIALIDDGDTVGVHWAATGTQRGTFEGLRPTNRKTTFTGMFVSRIVGGKIVESRNVWGRNQLLNQLQKV